MSAIDKASPKANCIVVEEVGTKAPSPASTISGTPNTAGSYTATLTAKDTVLNRSTAATSLSITVDVADSTVVTWVKPTPAPGELKDPGFEATDDIDYIFVANIDDYEMDIRYNLITDLGIVPGSLTALPVNTLPSWLTWSDEYGGTDNPTIVEGYAQITGTAPSQDIEFDYPFTVRAYDYMNFDLATPATYNDRAFEITILQDPSCLSPVNNICT